MLFITLGSQKFQFNRLLKAVDDLVEQGIVTDEVFAQIGYSDYVPRHYAYKDFLDRDEFAHYQDLADTVITHGGTGAIIGAAKKGKKIIAMPRLAKYGEHVDDHQLQLIGEFDRMQIILACYDEKKLGEVYRSLETAQLRHYQSNPGAILDSIDAYIREIL